MFRGEEGKRMLGKREVRGRGMTAVSRKKTEGEGKKKGEKGDRFRKSASGK